MINCALPYTITLSDDNLELLKPYYEFSYYDATTPPSDTTQVIVGTPPQALPENLEWIQLIGVGYDHLNLDALRARNITITNGAGTTSVAIAEYVVGAILYCLKDFKTYAQLQQDKAWSPLETGKELTGSSVAILGTGNIGSEISKRLQAFNVSITGFNSKGSPTEHFDSVYALNQFDTHASSFDVVIIALPLNTGTHHFIDGNRLKKLNKNAILINIGRGPVIHLDALESLIDTHLSHVVLDVIEIEPLPETSMLWHHPKAIITPHISYMSQHRLTNVEHLIVDNLLSYAKGIKLKNII